MGCIFWMVHVMTKFYIKHIYKKSYTFVWSFSWPHDLWTGWPLTFGWPLKVTLVTILSNIWINFTFGKLFTWTGIHNDNIMTTSYRLHKRFWAMFEPTLTWQNFSVGKLLTELAHIMTTYDFLWAKPAILSNIRTDFSLINFHFWTTFHMNCHIYDHIWLTIG